MLSKYTKILSFITVLVAGYFLFVTGVQAQNFSECIRDKTVNQTGYVCSLCGDSAIDAERESNCDKRVIEGYKWDASTCSCINTKSSCSGISENVQKSRKVQCFANGNMWNYSSCECINSQTAMPIVMSPTVDNGLGNGLDDTTNSIIGIFDRVFFKTNFDGSVDNVSELIRMAFIIIFMIIAIVAFFLGIYGMYLYSTAFDDDEKVSKAQKIFKDALIGLFIAIAGIVLVQVVAIFLGVDSADLFTFNVSN